MMAPMPADGPVADGRPTDRRPAIWPWLVMPLITLTLFYCLDRLLKDAKDGDDITPAQAAIHAPTDAPTEPTNP
jgi:hypothetical protein